MFEKRGVRKKTRVRRIPPLIKRGLYPWFKPKEGDVRILVPILILLGAMLSGCSVRARYTSIDDVPPSPNLPPLEQVAAIGLRAVQLISVALPESAEIANKLDTNSATSAWVQVTLKTPPQTIVSGAFYLPTMYAFAHQWGIAQLAVDYLRRCETFLDAQISQINAKRASLAWSNFFLAMSSVGYGLSNTSSQSDVNRLSNELGISRNTQSMQLNNPMSEYHSGRVDDIATLKHQVKTLKEQMTSYAKLLEIARNWILEEVARQEKEIPSDVKTVLDAKVPL